ncbi:MAG: peptidylprolyl isomerase [Candidatus Thioglobus sp.]|nr:peptidylprolyl isomerase [Candidatus Thioglobus sp.]
MLAIVDEEVITSDAIAQTLTPTATKAQKLALLNQKIDLVLQLKHIKKIGLTPKPQSIQLMLNRIAAQNKLTPKQLQASADFDIIVENVSQNLALRGLKSFVLQDVTVKLSQAEIDTAIAKNRAKDANFGKQIKIAQILVSTTKQTSKNHSKQYKETLIKQFLTKLTKQINGGIEFSSLAKLHSEDPSYANGGESDWLNPAKFPELIKQQLARLKLGQISKPFATKKGWRIIKITQQRNDSSSQFANIKSQLISSKEDIYFQDWLKKLRKNAYIEIFQHKL